MVKRLVVLIDGTAEDKNGGANLSNIQRLKELVRGRSGVRQSGGAILQITRFYVATGNVPRLSDRFRTKIAKDNTEELVKDIVKDVCSTLESPKDELWLYGSGHGAYVARAVAGIVHHIGLPRKESEGRFDELFALTCALLQAQDQDDYRRGPQLVKDIKSHADGPPRIPFVGLFDTVKLTSSKIPYDISFVSSIETLRHALAMNETRSSRTPETFDTPTAAQSAQQSLIQAWFVGTHDDLCGGTASDGLSLYPLQWIVVESIRAGLNVGPLTDVSASTPGVNPLSLVFPQYAGNVPPLDGSEEIEWCLAYSNGIRVSMFDLQSSHSRRSPSTGTDVYGLKFDTERYAHAATRKIFELNTGGLKGWCDNGPYGTIIHPSVFCVLDRYPRRLELHNFKTLKLNLSKFQDTCLLDDGNSLAPWLQGMQLQASGVKAFRILVCGKTGVGKSTLINKVFGVEMTAESRSYEQGAHDINAAFESPRHPGLLMHDSRGWQAGSDTELDLIAKFLRHRAFQEDPAEALHVIWFCIDSDVSRIEEADKRTFATLAQFSHQVPVFIVGTKKDKLTGFHKVKLLEEFMEKTNDYKQAKKLAEEKANEAAETQFAELRNQLSQIEHYKADGFCCLSKDDEAGVKDLLSQTLALIVDERVRLFCVAAQVVDVEQKINSAITECMRLGTHAIRTAAVPLPFTGMIATPTVSRLICESVLQCFGFPKAAPDEVEAIMRDIVMGNLKKFMAVSLTQFLAVSVAAAGVAVPTAGIGVVVGAVGCLWALPVTARMLLKCSCDMILVLERSFRYEGKYVSTKQIEDAAKYYSTSTIKTFAGKEKRLQQQVHDEVDQLIPLKSATIGFKFNKLRGDVERIVSSNRFDGDRSSRNSSSLALNKSPSQFAELPTSSTAFELPADLGPAQPLKAKSDLGPATELDSVEVVSSTTASTPTAMSSPNSAFGSMAGTIMTEATTVTDGSHRGLSNVPELRVQPPELEGETLIGGSKEEGLVSPPPSRTSSGSSSRSRWGRLSLWKFSSKKSKK